MRKMHALITAGQQRYGVIVHHHTSKSREILIFDILNMVPVSIKKLLFKTPFNNKLANNNKNINFYEKLKN